MERIFENPKRILVTGGGGFIGGCLIRRLMNESNVNVFNLDKCGYSSDFTWIDSINNKDKYQLIKINLTNSKQTNEAIEKIDPDLVIHLAAESHVDRSIDNPKIFIESNIIGTFNLLEALRKHWGKLNQSRQENFRFHHVSTDEVFGSLSDTGQFTEKTPYDPRSPYSASKASSDHLVRAWYHTYGLPIVLTNCSNNFGPWQFPEKLIPVVILKAVKEEEIPLYGNGQNIRDWLFVEDHIDALLKVAKNGKIGNCYCIGGHGEKTNKEIILKICQILDKKLEKNFPHSELINYVKDRPGHDKRYSIDSTLISKELNWKPKNNLETNLEKTVDWYLKNLNWCKYILEKANYSGERIGLKSIK